VCVTSMPNMWRSEVCEEAVPQMFALGMFELLISCHTDNLLCSSVIRQTNCCVLTSSSLHLVCRTLRSSPQIRQSRYVVLGCVPPSCSQFVVWSWVVCHRHVWVRGLGLCATVMHVVSLWCGLGLCATVMCGYMVLGCVPPSCM
jgi:hypothetical protein